MKLRIGVIFGGKSVEHEISVVTALQAMDNIDHEKYDVVPIYITKDLEWYTGGMLRFIDSYKDFNLIKRYAKKVHLINKNNKFILQRNGRIKREIDEIHLAFPIVHGANVEDGTVQGYLNLLGIPYVGSNVYASAVGQDKAFMKLILKDILPITNFVWFLEKDYRIDKEAIFKEIDNLKYPLIIKPSTLGSSVGIETISRKEELESAIERVFKYDKKIIIEEKIEDFIEYNCSVLGTNEKSLVSSIEEIKSEDIRIYKDKFRDKEEDRIKRTINPNISSKLKEQIEEYSLKVFRILNNSGIARIDFLYDNKTKKLYVDEINTIPNCFSYYLWEDKNIPYRELINIIIKDSINDVNRRHDMLLTIDSNLLNELKNKDIKEMK